jgi:hypothetical protein
MRAGGAACQYAHALPMHRQGRESRGRADFLVQTGAGCCALSLAWAGRSLSDAD